jgi:hypothetical protein
VGLEDRLRRLEEKVGKREWVVPIATRMALREFALAGGEDVGPLTEEEVHYLWHEDVADAEGRGALGSYRNAPGWQDSAAQAVLDEWQREAQHRLNLTEELGEEWRDVYNKDLVGEAQEEGPSIFDLLENEQDERKTND